MRLRTIFVALAVTVILAACEAPSIKYRYKLTIEADAGGQVKTASSVVDVAYWLDIDNSSHAAMQGEALYLDLGSSCRPLVALLTARSRRGASNAPCQWGENGPGCLHDLYGTENLEWNC